MEKHANRKIPKNFIFRVSEISMIFVLGLVILCVSTKAEIMRLPNEQQNKLSEELMELKFKIASGACPVKVKLGNSTITIDKRGLTASERYEKSKIFSMTKSNVAFYLQSKISRTNITYFCAKEAESTLFTVLTSLSSDAQYKKLGTVNDGVFYPKKHEQALFISESLSYLEYVQDECKIPEESVLEAELAILRRFEIIAGIPNEETSLNCPMTVCTEPNEMKRMVNFGKIGFFILLSIYIAKVITNLIHAKIKMVANSIEMHQNNDEEIDGKTSGGQRIRRILSKIIEIILVVSNMLILAMPPEVYDKVICKT